MVASMIEIDAALGIGLLAVLLVVTIAAWWRAQVLSRYVTDLLRYADGCSKLLMQCDKELLDTRGHRAINEQIRAFVHSEVDTLRAAMFPRLRR